MKPCPTLNWESKLREFIILVIIVINFSLLRFGEAAPLLEVIFYIREKLVTICHVSVLECLIELVACLAEVEVTIFPVSDIWSVHNFYNPGNNSGLTVYCD